MISITDGQIFLENDLFNSGIRPAINVGISVSRVGGNAQVKAMKKVAGTLKLDQAQYRELEAFSKFGSDVDAATMNVLDKGRKNVELLKQGQYQPVSVERQIAIIYCGTKGLLRNIPIERTREFEVEYLDLLALRFPNILEELKKGVLSDEITTILEDLAKEVSDSYELVE